MPLERDVVDLGAVPAIQRNGHLADLHAARALRLAAPLACVTAIAFETRSSNGPRRAEGREPMSSRKAS
ncbi:MAG TPA: hypothetical protein VLX85_12445 [Stellaceae bacterium]|nr:hypothetical protein [Stellaceae bacterium]